MFNNIVKNLEKDFKRQMIDKQNEMLETFFKSTLKPKPRFFPAPLWLWLASFFIKLK